MSLNKTSFNLALLLVLPALFLLCGSARAQVTYKISARQSSVAYHMVHPMHEWEGISRSATGTITTAPDGKPLSVQITIPVQSFDSGNGSRDSHMAEAAESYIFKNVVFQSTAMTPAPSRGDTLFWNVSGKLNFHGVTRPLSTVVRVLSSGNDLHAFGRFQVSLTEHGIKPPRLMMVPVRDQFDIRFDVLATR